MDKLKVNIPPGQKPGAAKPGAGLLDQILAPANLAAAWEAVAANEGMPGVDRVATGRYARNWEERVTALADDVRGNRYRPSRLRVRFIPKQNGGQRRISIPIVADRVLQRATLQVLLPRFDRKFLSCSYGYRPKRGVAQAVAAVIRYRDRGLRTVLEADIDDCFGSVDHEILLRLLEQEAPDWRVLQLMRWWLDVGRPQAGVARGIALGMPISPLWANLYLHEMDWQLVRNRWAVVRYADDFVVLVESAQAGELARKVTTEALAGLKMRLEPTKTRVSSFTDGFEYLGVRFQGDSYSFLWEEKRITVAGKFDWLWSEQIAYEY
jgi:group II intron reverse transcriptase/maturase